MDICSVRVLAVSVLVSSTLAAHNASAQMTPEWRAEVILQLLPPDARDDAGVLFRDRDGDRWYRHGSGRFLCVSDESSPERLSMVCHHHALERRLRLERTLAQETQLRGDAFHDRLCREVHDAGLRVPNGAMEITASLARATDGTYESSMTVYHLLWLPNLTEAGEGVTDEDPGDGRPWLHQAGTCGAHVMWSDEVSVPPA